MLKIGVTGGIGSGKTTICKIFELLNVPVFYADTAAKQLMLEDAILINGVKAEFGEESYFADGTLNNKHIAGIVFNDAIALERLNALVHPAVFRAFDSWVDSIPLNTPYILKEAALLFESGSYKMCDQNILVTAPEALKIDRVIERDNVTVDQVRSRMDKQFTDEQKTGMADHIIRNNESESLLKQVLSLHKIFLRAGSL